MSSVTILLLASSMCARATLNTNYGDFEGSTVWYNQVSEANTVAIGGAYREPTITVDTLDFLPLGMKATSTELGSQLNDYQLAFNLEAKAGKYLAGLTFKEGGDFSMGGSGITGNTGVDVTANFRVTIFEVDHVGIDTFSEDFTMTFSPNADGTFQWTDGPGGFGTYTAFWDGSIYIDFDQMLSNKFMSAESGVTGVKLNIDNWLYAQSEAGTSAEIAKKGANAFSVTSDVVPEPASAVLLVGTVSLLTFIRRKFIV